MPERHTDAREELARAEGLAQVVVGAAVERGDLVALLAARRQHDDRDGAPLADAPDDFESIHVGQSEIDDDHVGLARAHFHDAVGAGPRLEQAIALAGERGAEKTSDLRLVLDEDDDRIRHPPAPQAACPPAAA